MGNLITNRLGYECIKKSISDAEFFKSIGPSYAGKLLKELNSDKIVWPEAIPSDVVTMDSIVKLSFLNNNK